MSKINYEERRFTPVAREFLESVEQVCDDYARQGYSLTLRQLYYRLIATDAFPDTRWFFKVPGSDQEVHDKNHENPRSTKNVQRNYKWLGDLVSDARIAGLIDWDHVEDRTRNSAGGDAGYGSPEDAVNAITDYYSIPHWTGQPERIEVWVEKEALADVVSRPCSELNVPYLACKGYLSQSEMHTAAQRLRRYERRNVKTTIVHLGDHDPSGLDMTEDIRRRLALFRSSATVERIALNMDQVQELNPPPSPAKITDSRAADYISQYGDDSWELDAIEPAALETLVRDAIMEHVDESMYQARVDRETRERMELEAIRDNWEDVRDWMIGRGMLD